MPSPGMQRYSTRLLLFIFTIPGGQFREDCHLGWKGDHVNPIEDCNIFNDILTINMTKLITNPKCASEITVWVGDKNQGVFQKESFYDDEGHQTFWKNAHDADRKYKTETVSVENRDHCNTRTLMVGILPLNAFGLKDQLRATSQLDPEECFKRKNMNLEEYNDKTRLNLISGIGKANKFTTKFLKNITLSDDTGAKVRTLTPKIQQ